ncbi:spore protease YyaC [Paenibacillus xylaniclasticus]|uniref:spore protease YyaC n=1 Tax=Paenibacillus xylaniclasticus TaxID=588083 RepID=UPI000FDC4621|nr:MULTISPECIES: spore protease YyaC [Paenibacillus]GFN32452.1 spore protease YyaC [Paenibacillus curdlanolyticus]
MKVKVPKQNIYKGFKKEDIHIGLKSLIPRILKNDDVYFVCIGTDRCTGDSLAPLVGSELVKKGYKNVIGTIDDPVHAMNLQETINNLPKDKVIIAIDAALGKVDSVGLLSVFKGSLRAGAGVNKDLPPVGDYGIHGVVNVGGFMEYAVLQNTRLSLVMRMANDIVWAINKRFPVKRKAKNNFILKY